MAGAFEQFRRPEEAETAGSAFAVPPLRFLGQEVAAHKRDAILKRMLNTPPKPKKGKGGGKKDDDGR